MVVIKECFPTQIDFITSYMEKRRQQMEIMKQRNFKYSSVPREEEIIIPFDDEMTQNTLDNNEGVEGSGDMKTPKIIPLDNEPIYVKNFKMFIKHTQCHLDQVLANNRKIDDFHDIVTEIQMPSVNEERLESGADIIEDDITYQEETIETDEIKSNHQISKTLPSDDNRGNTTSQLKVKKIPSKTGTTKGIQKKHKSARLYENDVKIDSFMKDNLVKKVSWRDQQNSRTLTPKISPTVKKNLSSSSLVERTISPTPCSSLTTLVQTSNEKIRKLGSASSSKISIVEKSSRSFSARPSNSPLNSSRSITRGRDAIKTMSSVAQHKITMREIDFKTNLTARRDSCSSSVPPAISNKNLVQIPVSIINL